MRKQFAVVTIALVLLAGAVFVETAMAQGPEVPPPPAAALESEFRSHANSTNVPSTSDSYWAEKIVPAPTPQPGDATGWMPTASGGPDDYGYTWTDNVSLNWISAAGGFDTGINSNVYSAGPISIGFNFKYYENTYADLWISRHGFVAFASSALYESQSEIPLPSQPNNVIAPHWVPSDGVNGYVRYLRGGTAPNRWLVVEWNRLVSDYDTPEEYTFEVVLYENGSILFQYQAMNVYGSWYCQSSGIEDSTGLDGLTTSEFCQTIPGNRAIRISRPGPSARVRVFPFSFGRFGIASERVAFDVPVKNTGDLGPDTFDISVASRWPVRLYHSDGNTSLTDSDGDGLVDTGSVASGQEKRIVVKVLIPPTSSIGNSNSAEVTFRSSRNVNKAKTATLQTALAAPFAQSFVDGVDGAMKLQLARPDNVRTISISPDNYYGFDMAVAESQNGTFLYLWSTGHCINSCNTYVYEIEYEVLDRFGNVVRGISKLTDNSSATVSTYDVDPVVAINRNGRAGVLWTRYLYDSSTSRYNYNVYFAVIEDGVVLHGPTNITNNANWGAYGDLDFVRFSQLSIAATNDNRFVLAWTREHQESAGWVDNVWYTVRSADGAIIRDTTRLTNDTPGWDDYYEAPSMTPISGNRMALFLERQWDIHLAVLSSNGDIVRSLSRITDDGLNWGRSDAVTTKNGNMVIGWHADLPPNPGESPWTARYFNNETLSGSPALTRQENTISYNWEEGRPAPAVNADFFSVRWEGTIDLEAGQYEFFMGSDDGSKLWIDGQLVMDHWSECCEYWRATVDLSSGPHQIRMEMHEHDGGAWAFLGWWENNGPAIRYAVVNPDFQRIAGPVTLQNRASLAGDAYVSVTTDGDNNAILTWADNYGGYYPNLYYAMIDGANGNILTQPMIFQTSEASDPYIYTSYEGASNTSYIAQPYRTFFPATTSGRTDFCEPNDGRDQARCSLLSNLVNRASISSPNEWDFYIIDLPADHAIEVWLDNIPSGHDYNLYLFNTNVTNSQVGYSGQVGNQSEHIRTQVLPNGRYYVAVKGASGYSTSLRYSLRSVFR